jgi:signal transduction histidine kinase
MNFHTLEYQGRRAALVIAQDTTKRKKLEMDLRHAQKLEAVGGLAAGIAHEINTPVQFVGDNLRFLQDSFGTLTDLLEKYRAMGGAAGANGTEAANLAEDEDELEYLVDEIPKALSQSLDGVERVASIVKAMKEFAHPEQKQKVAANLNRALESTLVVARNELKYVADVETDFGDIPAVECYPGDLNQVFLNLLINAAHAIQDAVDGSGSRGTIRVKTSRQETWVTVSISDTGCGIPENIRDKLFDPFFTTKEVGRGTGQGLAISRSIIVDKHGGKLTFESQLGRGTTFTIQLPIAGSGA